MKIFIQKSLLRAELVLSEKLATKGKLRSYLSISIYVVSFESNLADGADDSSDVRFGCEPM